MSTDRSVRPFLSRLALLRVGGLGRDAILGSFGLGVRALIQAGYLVLLSRWMGARSYGMFAGSMAAVMLVAPLAGWGVVYVLSRRVALDRTVARQIWATAIAQSLTIGAVLVVVVVALTGIAMYERIDLLSILLLSISELMVLPIAQAATGLCFALGRSMAAAMAICLVPAGRLCLGAAAVWLGISGEPGVVVWSHFIGSILGVMWSMVLIARVSGLPSCRAKVSMSGTFSEGTSYAVGTLVGQSYQEVDKVLMLQTLGAAVVGPYTAAFRIVSVFALPVSGLVNAALPKMFAAARGQDVSSTFRALTVAAVGYGIIAAAMAACMAPLVPHLFGREFSGATQFLIELSPWPALFGLHQAIGASLTASGRQRERVLVEAAGMMLIIAMNLLLLHRMGGAASALSLLVGEALMALACLWFLRRRPKIADSPLRWVP